LWSWIKGSDFKTETNSINTTYIVLSNIYFLSRAFSNTKKWNQHIDFCLQIISYSRAILHFDSSTTQVIKVIHFSALWKGG
jgi:hypothetical protein